MIRSTQATTYQNDSSRKCISLSLMKNRGGKTGVRWAKTLLSSIVYIFLLSSPGFAHEARPAYLGLTQTDQETYDVIWKVPSKGRVQRLALNLRFSSDVRYTTIPITEFIGGAHVERSSVTRPGGLNGSEIFIEGLSRTMTDALVRLERLDGSTQIVRLSPDSPSFTIEATPSSFDVSKTYTLLGVQHILKGIDHLLFVACLLLVAGIRRRLLITITGFTLAHSITLALATLDIVRLPVPPVEAVIALSIVFLATEIARGDRSGLTYRYPVFVSISFGLLHGFGFAAVLNEIGLPRSDVPLALLFFNLGVEIGQIMFLGALIGTFLLLKQASLRLNSSIAGIAFSKGQTVAAYAIGAIASFWTIERIVGF